MLTNKQLQFVREKIFDLNNAVFYNLSDSVLRMPNSVISVRQVDEAGQIWFFISRPGQHITEFGNSFFSRLDFLRKGKNFFLQIEGKAELITDPEEINNLDFTAGEKETARRQAVLVKVRIANVVYTEKKDAASSTWFERARVFLLSLAAMRQPAYRLYHFQPGPVF